MALKLNEIRRQIILVLYDFMLSANEDEYWYRVPDIRELLNPDISGALVQVAINSLVAEKLAEKGTGDDYQEIYALTPKGIVHAEKLVEDSGSSLSEYAPAPSSDLLLSQVSDGEKATAITVAVLAVREAFEQSNQAGRMDEVDKAIIAEELLVGENLAKQPMYRLRTLKNILVPCLRFLAEKFAGTSIEEAAKHLMKLLLG